MPDAKDEKLATLRKKAAELKDWADEQQRLLDESKAELEKINRRMRYFSRRPEDQWQMPRWLWIPLVVFLVGILPITIILHWLKHSRLLP